MEMPFDIPNYDDLVIEAESLRGIPAATNVDDAWDPMFVELDLEELEQRLPRK
jgi:hypothetical protein